MKIELNLEHSLVRGFRTKPARKKRQPAPSEYVCVKPLCLQCPRKMGTASLCCKCVSAVDGKSMRLTKVHFVNFFSGWWRKYLTAGQGYFGRIFVPRGVIGKQTRSDAHFEEAEIFIQADRERLLLKDGRRCLTRKITSRNGRYVWRRRPVRRFPFGCNWVKSAIPENFLYPNRSPDSHRTPQRSIQLLLNFLDKPLLKFTARGASAQISGGSLLLGECAAPAPQRAVVGEIGAGRSGHL